MFDEELKTDLSGKKSSGRMSVWFPKAKLAHQDEHRFRKPSRIGQQKAEIVAVR